MLVTALLAGMDVGVSDDDDEGWGRLTVGSSAVSSS